MQTPTPRSMVSMATALIAASMNAGLLSSFNIIAVLSVSLSDVFSKL